MITKDALHLGYNIISCQARDFYKDQPEVSSTSQNGFEIYNENGEIKKRLFKAVLDYSLDLIELKNCYKAVYRNNRFSVTNNGFDYTLAILNVNFDVGLKLYNHLYDGIYLRNGYKISDCVLKDGVCVVDGVLVAIHLDKTYENKVCDSVLEPYFKYEEGKYVQKSNIPTIKSVKELREYFYQNGLICNGEKYVRYKRSGGSSRDGNCLFILEKLYAKMQKWSECGLSKPLEGEYGFLASWEAYFALSLSGIEKTIELNPYNILVLKDKQSVFLEEAVVVSEVGDSVSVESKQTEICNTIWDGEGLLDQSIFAENGYIGKGMMLLRGRFFKCCAFNTNLQKWFADNNITNVSQLNGETKAEKIEDIKLVVTESSIKYLKFGSLDNWRKNVGELFGVVKTDKPTHYFNGRMVRTNYQLLNTLSLSKEQVKRLLQDSIDYLQLVHDDLDIFRYHIKYAFRNIDYLEIEDLTEIIWVLLGINKNFSRTKIYKDFLKNLITSIKKQISRGQILIRGTYATLFGNGYELLCETIRDSGEVVKITSGLNPGQIMTSFFERGKKIVGARSPHITMGNLYLAENAYSEKIATYFNLSPEIVYVNAIGENLQQRLNGCDYDSDTMLLSDNQIIVDAVTKNYNDYKVPVFKASKNEAKPVQQYSIKELVELDFNIQQNKVGEIVNLSQLLNSLYWHNKASGDEGQKDLYNDICTLAVLSGLEIDKAKRSSEINVYHILFNIRQKYIERFSDGDKKFYPLFFKEAVFVGKNANKEHFYSEFNTTMDYVYSVIHDYRVKSPTHSKDIAIIEIVNKPDMSNRTGYARVHKERVLAIVTEYQKQINELRAEYLNEDADRNKIFRDIQTLQNNCVQELKNDLKQDYTVYITLKEVDNKKNSNIRNLLLFALFNEKNKTFIKMLNDSKDEKVFLMESKDSVACDYKLYDYYFKRIALQKQA